MIGIALSLWAVVAGLGVAVHQRRGRVGVKQGGAFAWKQAKGLSLRLPFALLTAAFLSESLPMEHLAQFVGPQSGVQGLVLSALLGGLLPGGPMTSFPIALVIFQAGAGTPQIVSFLAGWSVFAMHRVIAYEAPILGWRFVGLRLLACAALPVLSGLLAAAVLAALSPLQIDPI
ncbi:MAG: Uncharacterised protein [Halieaceae bacterium]|jgi:uncharacterized membrane protein YraQ (UPF0718 family)|nr:MAG: Uncharacterised protein [Halieaceae bacterium]|tara:strand:+ start:3913 stop:4434 length:522 start_codon:yes stop_codon:yes gene_type:complete